jgi:hypothetical protein
MRSTTDVLGAGLRPDVEVGVVLERHTDQVAHRVLAQLGKLFGRQLGVRWRSWREA